MSYLLVFVYDDQCSELAREAVRTPSR